MSFANSIKNLRIISEAPRGCTGIAWTGLLILTMMALSR
jgi:hypothetical protein